MNRLKASDKFAAIRLLKIKQITGNLSILAMAVTLIYALVFFLMGIPLLVYFSLGIFVIALGGRIAWMKNLFSLSRLTLVVAGNIFIFLLSGSLGRESGIELLYFALLCAILVLFSIREKIYVFSCIALTFILIFILEYYNYSIFSIVKPSQAFLGWMMIFSEFAAIVIMLVCVFSMQIASNQAETTLTDTKKLIEGQFEKLKSKNEELEQFTYIASHDLREPLRTVNSLVDLILENSEIEQDEVTRKSLRYIGEATNRMNQLIFGLLNYSRLGKDSDMEFVNLNKELKTVCEDLSSLIYDSQALVKINPLPELKVFPAEIRLLFQNLISNAIKFHKNGINPVIEISAEQDANGAWQFAVTDNGIGIEPQYLEKIFIIFQRLHQRHTYEGTGIGLAHCKKIVELHNGHIWATSVPNVGSTFHFTVNT